MGVEPYHFVSALNCVLAQRLVRRSVALQAAGDDHAETLVESALDPALSTNHQFYEGAGCIECGGTGFKGRTAICELMDLTDRIRDMILERRPTSEIKRAAHDEGMRFLRECAVGLIMKGETTLREINKVTFVEWTSTSRTSSGRSSLFSAQPPSAAIEIAAGRVSIAEIGSGSGGLVVSAFASEPLAEGDVTPALTGPNVVNADQVTAALRRGLRTGGNSSAQTCGARDSRFGRPGFPAHVRAVAAKAT